LLITCCIKITARHCLADGRGADRWTPAEDIPVPPLADAAAFDFKTCRGCCRPVTLTVNSQQQFLRKYAALIILVAMYVFYTVPLTFISTLVAPEKLEQIIPGIAELAAKNQFFARLLQGIVPAILNSLFFALCPVIFKAISNFGSNAISVNQAEYIALQVRNYIFTLYLHSFILFLHLTFSRGSPLVLLVFYGVHRFLGNFSCQYGTGIFQREKNGWE
jgi:hypothetical protein